VKNPEHILGRLAHDLADVTDELASDVARLEASWAEKPGGPKSDSRLPPVAREELLAEISKVEAKLQSIEELAARIISAEKL